MALDNTTKDSLVGLSRRGCIEGAICKLDTCEHCAWDKKEVKFDTFIHRTFGLLDVIHMYIQNPSKEDLWRVIVTLLLLYMTIPGLCE